MDENKRRCIVVAFIVLDSLTTLCGSVLINVKTYEISKSSVAPGLNPNCGEINLDTFNFSSGSIMLQSLWTVDVGHRRRGGALHRGRHAGTVDNSEHRGRSVGL